MLSIFRLYLVVGGMPKSVVMYLATNNLHEVVVEEENIIKRYKEDIAKYEEENKKLRITRVFEAIPGELNNINKRFVLSDLGKNEKAERYENSFEWLKKAGVAIAVYNAKEPLLPFKLSQTSTLFKLFMCDVGLLASMYMDDIQLRVLEGEENINFGSVYENYVAQELRAHGYEDLYYFNSRKQGEIDFIIPYHNRVLPIEVKSGKDYMKHAALNRVMDNPKYALGEAFVLSDANIERRGKILYLPIYMTMFIKKPTIKKDMVYKLDFSVLEKKKSM